MTYIKGKIIEGKCKNCDWPLDTELAASMRATKNNGNWGEKLKWRIGLKLCGKCFSIFCNDHFKNVNNKTEIKTLTFE